MEWNNPVSWICIIFASKIKKSAHNVAVFKINYYLCIVS